MNDQAKSRDARSGRGLLCLAGFLGLAVVGLGAGGYFVWERADGACREVDRLRQFVGGTQSDGAPGTDVKRRQLEREVLTASVQDLESKLDALAKTQQERVAADAVLRRSLSEFGDYVEGRLATIEGRNSELGVALEKLGRESVVQMAAVDTRADGRFKSVRFKNGDVYVGECREGKPDGFGTYSFHTGEKYMGMHRHGLRHGQGVFLYGGKENYVGAFRDGQLHGHGVYTYADGAKYVGEFKHNLRDGRGYYVDASGARIEGLWADNRFVAAGTK